MKIITLPIFLLLSSLSGTTSVYAENNDSSMSCEQVREVVEVVMEYDHLTPTSKKRIIQNLVGRHYDACLGKAGP